MNPSNTTYQKGTIGSDDFKNLVKSGQYVDKSLFIKDVINDEFQVPLITRPRRWSKSSNMSMLKTFIEIEVDEHGNELPEEKKVNPTYFKGGVIEKEAYAQHTLLPLKITQKEHYSAKNDYADYQKTMNQLGKHPVIMLNFKDLGASSCEELVDDLKVNLRKTFGTHEYLLNSTELNKEEKETLYQYQYKYKDVTRADLKDSISYLMRCLYKHFKKKCGY